MGVYFVSLLALARAFPEAQLLDLICAKSKQLHSLVGFAFGRYTRMSNGSSFPDTQNIQCRKTQFENQMYQNETSFSRYIWWVRLGTGLAFQ